MPDSAYLNDMFQKAVKGFLKVGLGVEDISVICKCPVEDVRREVEILREAGELQKIYEVK